MGQEAIALPALGMVCPKMGVVSKFRCWSPTTTNLLRTSIYEPSWLNLTTYAGSMFQTDSLTP
jgi:hypothetical protein